MVCADFENTLMPEDSEMQYLKFSNLIQTNIKNMLLAVMVIKFF